LKNERLIEISSKLNGIIFRKALMEKNFTRIYERILKEIFYLEDETSVLEIFGDLGG